MPLMVMSLLMNSIKNGPVPFFIKPVTNAIVGKIHIPVSGAQLQGSIYIPRGSAEDLFRWGPNLCGKDLTAAEVLMSFPVEAGQTRSGMSQGDFPLLWAYVDRLH